jgi:signal-transduction protein with cAMP-binding, CBS, and nucleotidyltransferase domain
MTAPLISVQHTATVHETLCSMEERQIRHVGVLSERKLVGVITQTELMHALTWDLEIERAQQK